MHRIAKQATDWAFAICAFFAFGFVLALVAGISRGSDLEVSVAGYSYRGPIYGCLPVMLVGLLAVGGSLFYLAISFQEGRSVAKHHAQSREIASCLPSRNPGHAVQDPQAGQTGAVEPGNQSALECPGPDNAQSEPDVRFR